MQILFVFLKLSNQMCDSIQLLFFVRIVILLSVDIIGYFIDMKKEKIYPFMFLKRFVCSFWLLTHYTSIDTSNTTVKRKSGGDNTGFESQRKRNTGLKKSITNSRSTSSKSKTNDHRRFVSASDNNPVRTQSRSNTSSKQLADLNSKTSESGVKSMEEISKMSQNDNAPIPVLIELLKRVIAGKDVNPKIDSEQTGVTSCDSGLMASTSTKCLAKEQTEKIKGIPSEHDYSIPNRRGSTAACLSSASNRVEMPILSPSSFRNLIFYTFDIERDKPFITGLLEIGIPLYSIKLVDIAAKNVPITFKDKSNEQQTVVEYEAPNLRKLLLLNVDAAESRSLSHLIRNFSLYKKMLIGIFDFGIRSELGYMNLQFEDFGCHALFNINIISLVEHNDITKKLTDIYMGMISIKPEVSGILLNKYLDKLAGIYTELQIERKQAPNKRLYTTAQTAFSVSSEVKSKRLEEASNNVPKIFDIDYYKKYLCQILYGKDYADNDCIDPCIWNFVRFMPEFIFFIEARLSADTLPTNNRLYAFEELNFLRLALCKYIKLIEYIEAKHGSNTSDQPISQDTINQPKQPKQNDPSYNALQEHLLIAIKNLRNHINDPKSMSSISDKSYSLYDEAMKLKYGTKKQKRKGKKTPKATKKATKKETPKETAQATKKETAKATKKETVKATKKETAKETAKCACLFILAFTLDLDNKGLEKSLDFSSCYINCLKFRKQTILTLQLVSQYYQFLKKKSLGKFMVCPYKFCAIVAIYDGDKQIYVKVLYFPYLLEFLYDRIVESYS